MGIFYATWFYWKTIIDRSLESDSAPYKLTMIFFSSVAQLETEISTPKFLKTFFFKTIIKKVTKQDRSFLFVYSKISEKKYNSTPTFTLIAQKIRSE